jgi:hypothetical protein
MVHSHSWAKTQDPSQKITKAKKGFGRGPQMVECLPIKLKALSSKPQYNKKVSINQVCIHK